MRKKLKELKNQRIEVRGTVKGFGRRYNNDIESKTICLENIYHTETSKILCNHLWFNCGKAWAKLNLKVGDQVQFEGKVTPYKKGYRSRFHFTDNRTTDYKLTNPTKIKVLSPR